ncbi:DeoR/GlpR family DNA-binding transcription regulator [Streptomyces phytophilus]|uniref:DeoR/GlpR family DNA-binding transcription regulator n=1 Tax=Streptomyces phytophilus TaxID=722715 RepID=UPI0015F0D40C|nr:DeoR/GlpR family DNA-binding transcription regulator [Streptomyces phytophilus]
MLAGQRHQLILQVLQSDGYATVGDLAGQLGASVATVRRDLVKLEDDGLLTRIYGGAVTGDQRPPFAEAAEVRVSEKDTIAAEAAAMVEDGQSIILDAGTTVHHLARHLHGRRLTVITNSLAVYEELAHDENIALMLLGGMVIRQCHALDGFMTEDNLRQVHADWLFMSAAGVRPGGQVMDTTVVEIPAKRAMIAASDKVALVADASKFPGTGMAKVCGPQDLDVVVTNPLSDTTTCTALEQMDVRVVQTTPVAAAR